MAVSSVEITEPGLIEVGVDREEVVVVEDEAEAEEDDPGKNLRFPIYSSGDQIDGRYSVQHAVNNREVIY